MAVEKQGSGTFAVKKAGDLECSMDGYTKMVFEITDLLLLLLALTKEIVAAIMPEDLKKAIKYAWATLNGGTAWIGFLIAAVFYFAEDQGYGDELCDLSSYGYEVIDFLHGAVSFAEDTTS